MMKSQWQEPTNEKGRTLILGGEELQEFSPGQFISWKCRDYISEGEILVEFGQLLVPDDYKENEEYEGKSASEKTALDELVGKLGFVLYEGTNTGDYTEYSQRGLSHRWNWGSQDGGYSFVIKPDGTGLFYDFSTAEDGMKDKADDVYKCSK
jgi:hypothetical protein